MLPVLCALSPAVAQTTIQFDVATRTAVEARTDTNKLSVTIRDSQQAYKVEVLQRGSAGEALAAQKVRTGWKEDYLFVRDDCQATRDGRRAWRCVVDQVFAFVESREGKRLVYIGDVFAGDDCAEEAKFGCALYDGIFTDIYDKLENNSLVPPDESPALLIEMRARGGEFVVDLDETWGRNQERYRAGERCLAASSAERSTACTDGISPRSAFLFNAALATYTRRDEQLARTRSRARSALCDGLADDECGERLRLSALMLANVRAGEKPRTRAAVTTLIPKL